MVYSNQQSLRLSVNTTPRGSLNTQVFFFFSSFIEISKILSFHFNMYYFTNIIMKICFSLLLLFIHVLSTLQAPINDTIDCIKAYIDSFQSKLDPKLYQIFKKAYPNTLETTVQHYDLTKGNQSTYIITGDIEAMWLRDSTNQFLPYIRMKTKCPNMESLSKGLINMQAEFIMIDGYTNAFKRFETDTRMRPGYLNDVTETLIMGILVDLCKRRQYATQAIWQRKFQIDSLAFFLRLAYEHYKAYGNIDFINLKFIKALRRLLTVLQEQTKDQIYQKQNNSTFYTFYRDARQLAGGHIKPSRRTGMVKTGFRPSDDPNQLAYNIPGNAMASVFLKTVAQTILSKVPDNSVFHSSAQTLKTKMLYLSSQIREGIYKYGIVRRDGKQIFAYEVNGFGDYRLYDDANLPSLISLPYFQFVPLNDQIYQNTRTFLLSNNNKYFYSMGNVFGIGSSHTSVQFIWPLALMTQILTSNNDAEIKNCLSTLVSSAINNLLHQSFSVSNPASYTRQWFAWANSFFGETIVYLQENKPHLVAQL